MKKQNWGRIVNITSIAGMEISGTSTYNVPKAAVTAYTKSVGRALALEKRNVVMTAVAPGVVMTDMASFFHSTIIHADGGQSRHYMSDSYLNK